MKYTCLVGLWSVYWFGVSEEIVSLTKGMSPPPSRRGSPAKLTLVPTSSALCKITNVHCLSAGTWAEEHDKLRLWSWHCSDLVCSSFTSCHITEINADCVHWFESHYCLLAELRDFVVEPHR